MCVCVGRERHKSLGKAVAREVGGICLAFEYLPLWMPTPWPSGMPGYLGRCLGVWMGVCLRPFAMKSR